MKKRSKLSTNLKVEAKIINCLNYLRDNYDKQEPKFFNSVSFTKQLNISATITTIFKNLGIIIPHKNSLITITDKLNEITPRQIHIAINDYKTESRIRVKKRDDKIKAKELAKIQAQMQFDNKQKLSGTKNNSGYKAVIDQEELRKQHLFGINNLKDAFYPKQTDMYFPPVSNKFEKPTVEEALSILKQAMKAELRETLRKEIIQELINKNI